MVSYILFFRDYRLYNRGLKSMHVNADGSCGGDDDDYEEDQRQYEEYDYEEEESFTVGDEIEGNNEKIESEDLNLEPNLDDNVEDEDMELMKAMGLPVSFGKSCGTSKQVCINIIIKVICD